MSRFWLNSIGTDYAFRPDVDTTIMKEKLSNFGNIEIDDYRPSTGPGPREIFTRPTTPSDYYGRITFESLNSAKECKKYINTLSKFDITFNGPVVFLSKYSKNLPLLQYVGLHINLPRKPVQNIINKYDSAPFSKKAILDCQMELIDNGFAGNAYYMDLK